MGRVASLATEGRRVDGGLHRAFVSPYTTAFENETNSWSVSGRWRSAFLLLDSNRIVNAFLENPKVRVDHLHKNDSQGMAYPRRYALLLFAPDPDDGGLPEKAQAHLGRSLASGGGLAFLLSARPHDRRDGGLPADDRADLGGLLVEAGDDVSIGIRSVA